MQIATTIEREQMLLQTIFEKNEALKNAITSIENLKKEVETLKKGQANGGSNEELQ